MDEDEQTRYVSQLREVFDSCDTTGTGYLDKEELAELCRKLHLEPHLPVLLNTLLGPDHYARVNFEEFKEGFVAVLSHSLELSTSEDESSYLEPVVPEEVKPKFVKGAKRYGRRSRPEGPDSETKITADCAETLPFRAAKADPFPVAGRRLQLRRSTSLESVESLKSDEEAPSNKQTAHEMFEAEGQLKKWKPDVSSSPRQTDSPQQDVTDGQMLAIWEELGVGVSGYLNRQELSVVCENIGLQDLRTKELDLLFHKLDTDRDGRVGLKEFQRGLFRHNPSSAPTSSTPIKPQPQRSLSQAFKDSAGRSASPSLLSATVGPRLLSCIDDGSGFVTADQVITIWSDEGIRNGGGILQMLDFPLDEKLSLAELTLALDNELLVSGNGLHQAALVSYKTEIQFLHVQAEQACKERDKFRADLERAEKRNVQLAREVDDRHAAMETLNESKIKDIEQEYRDKLAAMRSEAEGETERLLQQAGQHRTRLEEELESVRAQGVGLREDVSATVQENIHLEKELSELRRKLSESERTVSKLQRDLDHLLIDKFGSFDSLGTGLLSEEERFSQIIKEYELQCRELRDRNDELNTELEMLRGSRPDRKSHQTQDSRAGQSRTGVRPLPADSDSDDQDIPRTDEYPRVRRKLHIADRNGLGSLQNDPPDMSIETELAMQQLKDNHQQEVQDLKIQLETKVNFYERNIELMKRNMEVERKDIGEGFKLEISELEEQKGQLEERCERLQAAVAALKAQLQNASLGPEQEKRLLRERAELEQNYAKEISNLVQRLSAEKDQLEEELTSQRELEVQQIRAELDKVNSENSALKDQLSALQEHVQKLNVDLNRKTKELEQVMSEMEKKQSDVELVYKENARYRAEVLEMSNRNLQLSSENAELNSHIKADQGAIQLLNERLAEVSLQKGEEAALTRQLQEASARLQREQLQQEASWQRERELKDQELHLAKEQLQHLKAVESELTSLALKHQWLGQDKDRLEKEAEERNQKIEELQASLQALSNQVDQLHSQLLAANRDRGLLTEEAAANQKRLEESMEKIQELEASAARLQHEKEQLIVARRQQEQQEVLSLRTESQTLRSQSQDLQRKVEAMQSREAELRHVTQECQALRSRQVQLESDLQDSRDQLLEARTSLTLAQSRHARELEQLRERADAALPREQAQSLQGQLVEERHRGQELQEQLQAQAQQAGMQMSLQQEQYENVLKRMEEKMEDVEAKLRNLRVMLQEKVDQLKEQLSKNAKSDVLLKDLYVENSQLMKALQVTEQRQKSVEKKNFALEEKIAALNKLLRKIAPATLTA
ncbi:ninein-like protein isoform X2 [Amia ocellicauda]|uniref:ninein-like protein isoform X2 n=1 Tax=Amia ocellicauda TaxID=2972642 RepID=UPI003464AB5A